ncbi:binuclear zinc transcription factor [Podospora appendiculata]|uniref:Binuclear zinc transcription factor n=1 Tax=Podospora appendiculata TaxID=314037 RepID=A0AAE0XCY1_9PEZI|nr:binuclear zinc transcription factor [Podospora appendiculata]
MADQDSPETSRPVSLSCYGCRSRKAKCDRVWPRCGRCRKQGESCVYPGSRQSQVGKRKQVRDLEAKLGQLEDQLQNLKESQGVPGNLNILTPEDSSSQQFPLTNGNHQSPSQNETMSNTEQFNTPPPQNPESYHHELISLGLFEQLPSIQLIDSLMDLYFNKVHHSAPILHPSRFKASLYLPPHLSPPMCLQYVVMAMGAEADDNYRHLAIPFYQRARTYAESDEMRDHGEHCTTVAHAQFWALVAHFEAEQLMFPRAAMSLGRSIRIAQMLNLQRIDQSGQVRVLPQTLIPPRDWSELEERRRTWWVIYGCDRCVAVATGWPALINDRDVHTLLPASEEAFNNSFEEHTNSLAAALQHQDEKYSSFAGKVMTSHLFHRTLELTSDMVTKNDPRDIKNSPYWRRHAEINNELSTMLMFLPGNLQLPRNIRCHTAVFVNISIHSAIICLHRAALTRARTHQLDLPGYLRRQSQARLLPAAEEILGILRMTIDIHAAFKNPLLVHSTTYMAAIVFLDDMTAEHSHQSESNLDFLLNILVALGRTNAVTRSLAIQLAMDMKKRGFNSAMDKIKDLSPMHVVVPLIAETVSHSSNMHFCLKQQATDPSGTPDAPDPDTSTTDDAANQHFTDLLAAGAEDILLPLRSPGAREESLEYFGAFAAPGPADSGHPPAAYQSDLPVMGISGG